MKPNKANEYVRKHVKKAGIKVFSGSFERACSENVLFYFANVLNAKQTAEERQKKCSKSSSLLTQSWMPKYTQCLYLIEHTFLTMFTPVIFLQFSIFWTAHENSISPAGAKTKLICL